MTSMSQITVKKKTHPVFKDAKKFGLVTWLGRNQYIYSSKKGTISLVKIFHDYPIGKRNEWEIWSGDDLFEDVERFGTKAKAEKRIEELL